MAPADKGRASLRGVLCRVGRGTGRIGLEGRSWSEVVHPRKGEGRVEVVSWDLDLSGMGGPHQRAKADNLAWLATGMRRGSGGRSEGMGL